MVWADDYQVRLTLASDQDAECPPFTAESQPSKRAVVEKRSFEKRYDRCTLLPSTTSLVDFCSR